MAKKPAPKKVKIQLTLDEHVATKLKLAALATHSDMSQLVTDLILKEFSGLYLRGATGATGASQPAGQGTTTAPTTTAPSSTTTAPKMDVVNRLNDIARRANLPTDLALDSLGTDQQ